LLLFTPFASVFVRLLNKVFSLYPDSTGRPIDIHFVPILCPHVHGHEMDVHRISNFGHPLMTDIWTSI